MNEKLNLSVIIHTLNEELNLPHAINSVKEWVTEIFVVDSESIDLTQQIALDYNCSLIVRKCNRTSLVEQRNWALENLNFKTDWVFILDADEIVDEQLKNELFYLFNSGKINKKSAYSCRFKNIFFGKWLRYSSMYPTWTLRLFKHKEIRYELRAVNSHPIINKNNHAFLEGHLLSIENKNFTSYLNRIIEFSDLESRAYKSVLSGEHNGIKLVKGKLFGTTQERRRYFKNLFIKLPGRPFLIFIYLYFIRLGFLDGRQGLNWALFKFFAEWSTSMRLLEIKKSSQLN